MSSRWTHSNSSFRVFVSWWLYFGYVKGAPGERVNINRVPIGIERDGPVLVGAEDRRADVAIPLQDLWRGVAETVRPAGADHRDVRLERPQEFLAARRQAAVMRNLQHSQRRGRHPVSERMLDFPPHITGQQH